MRGAVHTLGLSLWFIAVTHISLADATAIGFTTPIFVMIGAVLLFKGRCAGTGHWRPWRGSPVF